MLLLRTLSTECARGARTTAIICVRQQQALVMQQLANPRVIDTATILVIDSGPTA